ncbi:MAG: hypothetical protein QOG31_1243 [Thermoplasmata archaeon]|jgi:hypothetical protein|nr:hypothetical protein [Thermoplasmata archaeon]
MRAPLALLAVALLAGCAQPQPGPALAPGEAGAAESASFSYGGQVCDAYLLAILVDPARTDPYLPPGFHLRDPSGFFPGVLPATGQALVILSAFLCGSAAGGNGTFQEAFAGVFVQPPAVLGERAPAQYDFYEVDHVTPPGALRAGLAAWGWDALAGNLSAQPVAPQGRPAQFTLRADGRPPLFTFGGAAAAPRTEGVVLVRLWRDGAPGVGRIDYALPLDFSFGPGTCTLSAALRTAALAGPGACPAAVVAAGPSFSFAATATLERGRHAR